MEMLGSEILNVGDADYTVTVMADPIPRRCLWPLYSRLRARGLVCPPLWPQSRRERDSSVHRLGLCRRSHLIPHTNIHLPTGPDATDEGGWVWKATVKSTSPKCREAEGKTVAWKDNIALAGVKCSNETAAVDWVPEVDAALVAMILNASGTILGKAVCEHNCFGVVRIVLLLLAFCEG